jgi:hypothetical protein
MKRSAKIGLVVMGALGVTVASGYWLDTRCDRQAKNDPQASPDSSCRHTSSGWHSSYGGHGSAPATKPSTSSPGTSTPARGGFGSTGKGAGGGT